MWAEIRAGFMSLRPWRLREQGSLQGAAGRHGAVLGQGEMWANIGFRKLFLQSIRNPTDMAGGRADGCSPSGHESVPVQSY